MSELTPLPFAYKASARMLAGTSLPLKDPLVAITMIAGKRHLTWVRNSRPDMPAS